MSLSLVCVCVCCVFCVCVCVCVCGFFFFYIQAVGNSVNIEVLVMFTAEMSKYIRKCMFSCYV